MTHTERVKRVQDQVREFARRKERVRIYHGTTNSTRLTSFERGKYVDVSDFTHVLELDTEQGYIVVEPNIPMDQLVDVTLRHNLIPPVVPEFPGITVGGAVQGGAEESSSFHEGMVHDTCLAYELVLGSGDVVTASREQRPELFWGTAASYGSLGVLTAVTLRLVPAQPFVELIYHPTHSAEETLERMQTLAADTSIQFMDAILFAADRGVIMTGRLSAPQELPTVRFARAFDEWFYLHAQKQAKREVTYQELVPIQDYLFRYNRGAFWMARHGIAILKVPFTRVTRFFLDGIARTRASFRFLHESELAQQYIIQDFNLPVERTAEFIQGIHTKLGIYPLWLCPLRPGTQDLWSANCLKTKLVINVGVWGPATVPTEQLVPLNQELERYASSLGGRKMLYAHAYYSQKDFWKLYDRASYEQLRSRYAAEAVFPDLYEKTHVSRSYRPSIWRGLWRLLRSPTKLRIAPDTEA